MKLLPIDEHCAILSEAIVDVVQWTHVSEWLMAGASIESVEVNSAKHDRSGGMCNDYGYGEAKDTLLKSFVEAYSVFSLVWGALEATLDVMNLPPHPVKAKRGKVSNACHYLQNEFVSRNIGLGLIDEVASFRNRANECLGFENVESRYTNGREFGDAAIGLFSVYELRNQFAHGSLILPNPDEDHQPVSPHRDLVKHATRIILIEIQMLVTAHLHHSEELGEFFWYKGPGDDGGYNIPLSEALGTLHLTPEDDCLQERLLP